MEREAQRLREARATADAASEHLRKLESDVLDAQKAEGEAWAEVHAAKKALIDTAMAQRVPVDG